MKMEYNERTCITAGKLRASGIAVPNDIPDCAWVPKHTMRFGEPDVAMDAEDPTKVRVNVPVTFAVPFRWVRVNVTLDNTPKDCQP